MTNFKIFLQKHDDDSPSFLLTVTDINGIQTYHYLGEFEVRSIRARCRSKGKTDSSPLALNTPVPCSWAGTKEQVLVLGRTIKIDACNWSQNLRKVRYAILLVKSSLSIRLFYDPLLKKVSKRQRNLMGKQGKPINKRSQFKSHKSKKDSNPFPLAKIVPNRGSIQILQGGAPGLGKRS